MAGKVSRAEKELEEKEGEQTELSGAVWRLRRHSSAGGRERGGTRVKLGENAEGPDSLDSFPRCGGRRERLQAAGGAPALVGR